MHVRLILTTLALSLLAFTGCGPQKPVLHLYTWADYIDPELLRAFEKANDCRVKVDTFDSNETMYAKMQAGSDSYDLAFPSSYQIVLMKQQNMVQKLDKSKLPNVAAQFDTSYGKMILNPEMDYSIPYAITFTGIAYRKDKLATPPTSWTIFDKAELKGRMALLNDHRETIGAALKFLGFSFNSVNPAELEKAKDVVLRWKKNIAKFDNEQYKTAIASGEFSVAQGYNGDIAQTMAEDPEKIGFIYPSEGFSNACDEMVIPKNAANPELAHAFINFIYDPDNAAQNIAYICTVMPNKGGIAKLPKEIHENPAIIPPASVLSKSEVIRELGEHNKLYTATWDTIKATE